MDFFDRQEKARRNTRILVFYFAVAVVLLVLATYAAVLLIFFGAELKESVGPATFQWWKPDVFVGATVATLAVILIGSISKTLQLSEGGSAVAEMLDGRLIDSNTTDPDERKLLHVVEEMAIASGVPVPQVYVMDDEAGINAFAAGHSPSDAAISATRGCMKLLSRDELQGVIGHEFSHILNGDMKLNLRLMGLIFGILCLTVIGRILARTRGRKNPLPLLGLALIVIGFAGVFFGRLIQAAVARQRESLADASAVQFTRNPQGLAGALKKIGGLAQGSLIKSVHAEEAYHLFFANGLPNSLFGLMSTHPPLEERIRELDPAFDGKFPTVKIETRPPVESSIPKPRAAVPGPFPGFPGMKDGPAGVVASAILTQAVTQNVGRPTPRQLRYAEDLHQAIPPSLAAAAREPLSASALLYAFVLSQDPDARQTQLDALVRVASDASFQETLRIWPATQNLPVPIKIPLLDLALPALRRFSPNQFEEFRATLKALIESDDQTSLFEYMLQKAVLRHLEPYFLPAAKPVTQFYALAPLAPECGLLLSAMAYAGQQDATQAYAAFLRGAQLLSHAAQTEIPFLPEAQCDLPKVDATLARLNLAVPQIKKNVLNACAETMAADGIIQESEAELLRAIADALDCPIPPFVQAPA